MAQEVDLQPLLDQLQRSLVAPTRSAALLPGSSDLSFERTLSRSFARKLDTQSTRILSLAQSILSWTNNNQELPLLDEDLIKDGEYSKLTQTVEHWLEQADEQLDKHLNMGKYKPQQQGGGAIGAKTQEEMQEKSLKNQTKLDKLPSKLLHDATLPKPQLGFTRRTVVQAPQLDDRSANDQGGIPFWKPILRRKLHRLNPESDESWLQTELYQPSSRFTSVTDTRPPAYTRYQHPYQAELASLTPPDSLLSLPDLPKPIPKDSFETTPFEWVGDEKALDKMMDEIRSVGQEGFKELAIDLEHHDFRSWEGFTCLIQLSTRKKDYVIDAINPGVRENLEGLNEFFTDPSWIKVLHGANSDIVWLQRDFGLYIVGLFDTYHATHVLGYTQHSLASLLDMYTDFEPDKRYQLADWRIRPLPQEMLHYARSDTHYLLSIYDHLRLALEQKLVSSGSPLDASSPSPVVEVFNRSIGVSQTTFSIPPFDHETGHFETGYLIPLGKSGQIKAYSTALAVPTLPIKTGWGPGEVRFEVLRNLVRWREGVARREDESTRFVMSLNGVLQVVEGVKRIVSENGGAKELIRVLGMSRGGVSELVRKRKEEIVELLRKTVEEVEGKMLGGEDVQMGDSTSTTTMGVMTGLAAFEPSVKPVQGLWESDEMAPIASSSSSSSSLSTSKSSFFGTATTARPSSTPPFTTSSSSFFGPASSSSAKKSGKNGKGKGKEVERSLISELERSEAVRKVHESLVLGGGLAKSLQPHRIPTAPTSTETPSVPTSSAMAIDPSTLPVQLPLNDDSFLPFSSTSSASTTPAAIGSTSHSVDASKKRDQSEVIVVSSLKDKPSRSSQQAQKKRRRGTTTVPEPSELRLGQLEAEPAKTEEEEGIVSPPPSAPPVKKQKKKKTPSSSSSSSTTPVEPVVPHDYSGSTSILDAGPSILTGLERREAEKKQKKKDKIASGGSTGKGFKVDTSEFKRPMRVDNAPKKANISRSFLS